MFSQLCNCGDRMALWEEEGEGEGDGEEEEGEDRGLRKCSSLPVVSKDQTDTVEHILARTAVWAM